MGDAPYRPQQHAPFALPSSRQPESTSIIIRHLPSTTNQESLRSLLIFSADLLNTDFTTSPYAEDSGFSTATAQFASRGGALEAIEKLNGKPNSTQEATLLVELYGNDVPPTSATSSGSNSASPPLPTTSGPPFPLMTGNGHVRVSGKSTINDVSDDETGDILKDPRAYAEAGSRRPTAPAQLPISQFGRLSLSPGEARPVPIYPWTRPSYPPVNPADQNPPCNTLYVGNLPLDTCEDELKAIFSKQRGYKRLCFRTKQNGPMCFVEFEDVYYATRALAELYGYPLHNSAKGGIRLSFSKNPLGVRSTSPPGAANAAMTPHLLNPNYGAAGGGPKGMFSAVSGPPPGLGITTAGMRRVTTGTTGADLYPSPRSYYYPGIYTDYHMGR
ncbi:hypothetical protein K470DRAFT_259343 [Piedraia hortae CBS 480.64]|uniref:RRM domain-containing protein n=1 Tax=Piedraia hortae CBS 480.64 TaxID=1314780 RepID=A0A6A7BVG0_9PEZI|nr:hypothetical protein K470DRAFT_259343 [Piedraia hortae CBS 480.64]